MASDRIHSDDFVRGGGGGGEGGQEEGVGITKTAGQTGQGWGTLGSQLTGYGLVLRDLDG